MSWWRKLVLVLGGSVVGALLLLSVAGLLLVRRYQVASVAMQPTLTRGDWLWTRSPGAVHAGDVVLVHPPEQPVEVDKAVTRVVAVGGQAVEGAGGHLVVDGRVVDEPYVAAGDETPTFERHVVPIGSVWVEGDHRSNAQGSHHYGSLPLDRVTDRVVWRKAPPLLAVLAVTVVAIGGYVVLCLKLTPAHTPEPSRTATWT